MSKILTRLLKPFRERESVEDLATIVDDPNAIRVIASWARIEKKWKKPRSRKPRARLELWWYLWKGVTFDRAALASAAKVTEQAAHALLRTCANARVIYPDGTLSEHAKTLIADHVANRMPGKRRGRPPGVRDSSKRKRKPATKKKK